MAGIKKGRRLVNKKPEKVMFTGGDDNIIIFNIR